MLPDERYVKIENPFVFYKLSATLTGFKDVTNSVVRHSTFLFSRQSAQAL